MRRRQTIPGRWLVTDERLGPRIGDIVRRMPRGSGVLVRHHDLRPGERQRLLRQLRRVARSKGLVVMDEADRRLARVHNAREILRARLSGAQVLLLSPLFQTRSHPEWASLPRMRVAALLRLAKAPVVALGGMSERRFRAVRKLGFAGWAGVDAWLRVEHQPPGE